LKQSLSILSKGCFPFESSRTQWLQLNFGSVHLREMQQATAEKFKIMRTPSVVAQIATMTCYHSSLPWWYWLPAHTYSAIDRNWQVGGGLRISNKPRAYFALCSVVRKSVQFKSFLLDECVDENSLLNFLFLIYSPCAHLDFINFVTN
jgi:hypothetical protein